MDAVEQIEAGRPAREVDSSESTLIHWRAEFKGVGKNAERRLRITRGGEAAVDGARRPGRGAVPSPQSGGGIRARPAWIESMMSCGFQAMRIWFFNAFT
jgi:hypothetical protein